MPRLPRKRNPFRKGAVLHGHFAQQGHKGSYSMKMTVEKFANGIISGVLSWPSLKGRSRFKGKVSGDKVYFSEYEVISGSGVGIPHIYEGTIVANSISGICRHADELGTFHMETKI